MLKRVTAGIGSAAIAASTILIAAPSASAAVEPPSTPIVRPEGAIEFPASYPSETPLPEIAADPNDASINRGAVPYDRIAPTINGLIADSDRVSAQVVGKSSLGRDIYLVTVTNPETEAEAAQQLAWRDEVKHEPTTAAADAALAEGYKVPIWYNGNIHGNEWEGTDITLDYIAELATSDDPETAALLDAHRIYFTVTNNPDGRALGQRATGAGYDANRDFITGATPESVIVRDLSELIQPTYFIDLHGYTGVLQVEPCGPPHGENYEYDLFLPHAYSAALAVEDAVVAADIPGNTYQTDDAGEYVLSPEGERQILIPYRDIRSGWDDWPPIFAPQYVAYQGGITNTVELPLGRVTPATDPENVANHDVDVQVGEIVVETIADYVATNRDALLANQIEIFERGVEGDPIETIPEDVTAADLPEGTPSEWTEIWDGTDVYNTDLPRAYMIPMGEGQRSDSDAERLVDQLLTHDIEVQRLDADLSVDGTLYPAGSFLVDMHQPLRGLANVLLADGSDISERVPSMYDISAWSLSLLWGADVVSVGSTTDAPLAADATEVTAVERTGDLPAQGSYLTLEPTGVDEYQAILEILAEGVPVSQLADGRVVLGTDAPSYAAAASAVDVFDVTFESYDGAALADASTVALSLPTVGYVGYQNRDVVAKLGIRDAREITAAGVLDGKTSLAGIDVLVGNLAFTEAQTAAGTAALQAFVAAGGDLVAYGTPGATMATTSGLAALTATDGTDGSNGIVSVDTPEDGVLGDYAQDTAFVYPATWFSGLGAGVTVEQTYDAADPFLTGHWAASEGQSQSDAAGRPSAVSAVGPTGARAFLFGTSPVFRNHPVGAFSDVARAVLWTADAGIAVAPPAVAAPLPEPSPTTPAPSPTPTVEPAGLPVIPSASPTRPSGTATARPSAVQRPSTGALASTGFDGTLWAGAALVLVLLGGTMVIVRRRRLSSTD